jgi:hypothetical protein
MIPMPALNETGVLAVLFRVMIVVTLAALVFGDFQSRLNTMSKSDGGA